MRKREKKMAEDFLGLLERVHQEIRAALDRGDAGQALALLEQCQQGAIQLGELLEKTEGEGCPAVGFLEDYCEAVYQSFEEVRQGLASKPGKVYKSLKKRLIPVENSLKTDVPVKWEVVFLPYKASMWDSLESIWKAAEADPACNAYVIAIPYYERRADGSLGPCRYEGSQFPEDVPVVSYEAYDLERNRPDIIYIHNPYDDVNYVTSVAPEFYSSELRKYTDCLVYVPYFIHTQPKPEKYRPETIEHFVFSPGVLNADRVILQSELIQSRYRDILLQEMGDTRENRERLSRKLLALGSPKYDRIAAVQARGVNLPEDWIPVVQKPDGSRKKIVFYNSGLGTLLRNNENWMEKTEEILSVFKSHSNETALLWRPHPLLEATLTSMRRSLLERYRKLKRDYIREAWGIFDDSSDMDRAAALSDAFYGDSSSIVHLFRAVGKPLKIQTIGKSAAEEYTQLSELLKQEYQFVPKGWDFGAKIHRELISQAAER